MKAIAIALITSLALTASAFGFSTADDEDQPSKVDLNRATAEQLMELPGIGEKVAQRIIAYREEQGPFGAIEELMNVRGIGEKTYLKIESRLTLTKESRKKK